MNPWDDAVPFEAFYQTLNANSLSNELNSSFNLDTSDTGSKKRPGALLLYVPSHADSAKLASPLRAHSHGMQLAPCKVGPRRDNGDAP